jgi:hypothetical protein
MKGGLEIASGIRVLFLTVVSSMAVLHVVFAPNSHGLPLTSILSLGLSGLAILLSSIGAFILLSWALKR